MSIVMSAGYFYIVIAGRRPHAGRSIGGWREPAPYGYLLSLFIPTEVVPSVAFIVGVVPLIAIVV
jgi:hypothetical protein